MKKRFLTFISLTVANLLLFLTPSCSGLATPSAPDAPEAQRYTLSGSFSMPYADAAPAEVTNATPSARNAVPDMSGLTYTVEAVRSDGHKEITTSEDHSTYTFTNLTAGSWQITAYAKTSDGTSVMQSETETVTLSKSKPDASTSLVMEPASGRGEIDLNVSWTNDSGIGYCEWAFSGSGSLSPSGTSTTSPITIRSSSVASGTHPLTLKFYTSQINANNGSKPLYSCTEYVSVYAGLETNSWTSDTAQHLGAGFSVTKECVETFVYRTIYVKQGADDSTATGTTELPFGTIEKAMERLNEVAAKGIRASEISETTPWELHVTGTPTVPASTISGGSFINVSSTIGNLAIIGEGDGATIDANSKGRVLNVASGANATMQNITLKGGNATSGGCIYMNSGSSVTIKTGTSITGNNASQKGGGIYSDGGTLTINGGTISSNTISSPRASGDDGGIGIYIKGGSMTMTGGEISANNKTDNAQTASYIRGGGIRLAGGTQFQMSGGKITNNQIRGLGANIFTQSAQIELSGTAEVSYGKIDNSDVSFNADAHGAAIWLEGSGTSLTMSGGEIFGNIAKTKDTKNASAGIYVNYATFTMTGGRIYNNEVQGGNNKGGAFRLGGDTNNGAIKISGSASIPGGVNGVTGPGKNDVYLYGTSKITITDDLTAATPIATITPAGYPGEGSIVSRQVLDGSEDLLSDNYDKFAVTPQSDGTVWLTNSTGYLRKETLTAADFTSATLIAAYNDSMTKDGSSFHATSLASMEGKTLLTWQNYDYYENGNSVNADVYTALTFSQIEGTSFHMTFKAYKNGLAIANIDKDYDLSDYETDEDFFINEIGELSYGDVGGEGLIYIGIDSPYAVSTGLGGDPGESGYYLIE